MVLATQVHLDFFDALRGSTTERVLRGAGLPRACHSGTYIDGIPAASCFIRRGCPGGYFATKDLNSEAVDASGFLSAYLSSEMPLKPLRRQARHFLQGTRLLKQMGRSWDHRQMFLSFELFISLPIEIDDNIVEPANDE